MSKASEYAQKDNETRNMKPAPFKIKELVVCEVHSQGNQPYVQINHRPDYVAVEDILRLRDWITENFEEKS